MIGTHLSISDLRWARSTSGRAPSGATVSAPAAPADPSRPDHPATQRWRKLFDHSRLRPLRWIHRVPDNHLKIRQPGLGNRRQIWRHFEALWRFGLVGLYQSTHRRLQNVARLVAHEIKMAAC